MKSTHPEGITAISWFGERRWISAIRSGHIVHLWKILTYCLPSSTLCPLEGNQIIWTYSSLSSGLVRRLNQLWSLWRLAFIGRVAHWEREWSCCFSLISPSLLFHCGILQDCFDGLVVGGTGWYLTEFTQSRPMEITKHDFGPQIYPIWYAFWMAELRWKDWRSEKISKDSCPFQFTYLFLMNKMRKKWISPQPDSTSEFETCLCFLFVHLWEKENVAFEDNIQQHIA